MSSLHYYCAGSCHAVKTEEEYSQGQTSCQSDYCSKNGQEFSRCDCDDQSSHKEARHDTPGHHQPEG